MARRKRLKIKEHQLYTVLPSVWKELKHENKIDPLYRFRAKRIDRMSRLFTFGYWLQDSIYGEKIRQIQLDGPPPVFILGLWRSGTTHLHYAMARDPQFGYLNNHQAFTFNMALLSGDKLNKLFDVFVPGKRPQDNVKLTLDEPAEEEQPMSTFTTRSPIHSFYFPRNQEYFRKFHLFEGISEAEKEGWRQDYRFLVKNIIHYTGKKRVLLKNPHNTGRLKELLEIFPDARFVFIHRNPGIVYQSTRKLYNRTIHSQFLQFAGQGQINRIIFENNAKIIDKYLNERSFVPEGNLVEIAYKDLENSPWETIQHIYNKLSLKRLDEAEPGIRKYLESVRNYRKNKHRTISGRDRRKLESHWAKWYDQWNYESL